MPDFESIWSAASELPLPDRLRLIDELASTVPDDRPLLLSAEWLAEIERRSAPIDAGVIETESWATVRERLLNRVRPNDSD